MNKKILKRKINKKILLNMIGITSVIAPVATLISCGPPINESLASINDPMSNSQSSDYTNPLAGTSDHKRELRIWTQTSDKEIKFWENWAKKYNNAPKNNIGDNKNIEVKTVSFKGDAYELFDKKGIKDPNAPDLFQMAIDQIGEYTSNKYLHIFKEKNIDQFEKKLLNNDKFAQAAKNNFKNIAESSDNQKLFSVPYNVEGQLALIPTKNSNDMITLLENNVVNGYSNLWSANGFFNDGKTNLADAFVQSESSGKLGLNTNVAKGGKTEKEWRNFIESGFKKMLASAVGKNFPQKMFDKKGELGTVESIKQFYDAVKNNNPFALEIGTWDYDRVNKALSDSGLNPSEYGLSIKSMPKTYKQWQGGWGWALNATLTEDQVEVAQDFITFMMNSENAVQIYEAVNNKILATEQSSDKLLKSSKIKQIKKDMIKAISGNEGVNRPATSAFNMVWDVYADTVDAFKTQLGSITKENINLMAKNLTDELFNRLATKYNLENKKIGS